MSNFGGMQNEIYNAGLQGILPDYPVDFANLERRAHEALGEMMTNYVAGGCGDEHTQDSNASAFHHWGMVPRMMVLVSDPQARAQRGRLVEESW